MRNVRNGREMPGGWTDLPNRRFLSLLYRPEDDGIPNLSFGFVSLPPLAEGGLHQHEVAHEFWVVLAGEGEAQIGEERLPIKAGDVVHGPPGKPHQLINLSSDAPLEAVYVLSPAGDERNVVKMLAEKGPQYLNQ